MSLNIANFQTWTSWGSWLQSSDGIFSPAGFVYVVHVPGLLHCSSALTAAFVSAVFQPGSEENTRQPLKDQVMDEFLPTPWRIYRRRHLWYLYVAAPLSSPPVVTASLFLSYLHPPLLLLAERLGADKFGREQAKGGQTRALCVYIERHAGVMAS